MSYNVWLFLHHFTYLTLIPAILWHAQASWEYILPAVSIWFFDRLLRAYRNLKAVNLVTALQASLSTGERFHNVNMFNPASIDPRFLTPEPINSIHDHQSYQQEKVYFQPIVPPGVDNTKDTTQSTRVSSLSHSVLTSSSHLFSTSNVNGNNNNNDSENMLNVNMHNAQIAEPLPVSPSFIHSVSSITNVTLNNQLTATQPIKSTGHNVPIPTTTKFIGGHDADAAAANGADGSAANLFLTSGNPNNIEKREVISAEALGGGAINFSGPGVRIVDRGLAGKYIELRIINDNMVYFPGHYAFINIAEISLFEWHPFTIASPAHFCARPEIVFIIKTMGPGTWTQSLYEYVEDYYKQLNANPAEDFIDVPLTVSLDGPCGTPIDFTTYDVVILLAGGIGITPCKSIYESMLLSYLHDFKSKLMLQYTQQQIEKRMNQPTHAHDDTMSTMSQELNTQLMEPNFNPILKHYNINTIPLVESNKRIHLFWAGRDILLFDIMSESLSNIPFGPFSASLFCDNPNLSSLESHHDAQNKASYLSSPNMLNLIHTGRPNLENEFLLIVNGLNPNSYLNTSGDTMITTSYDQEQQQMQQMQMQQQQQQKQQQQQMLFQSPSSSSGGPGGQYRDDVEMDEHFRHKQSPNKNNKNNNTNNIMENVNTQPLTVDPLTVSALSSLEKSATSRGPVDPTSSRHGGFVQEDKKRVLVFSCGPGPMVADAEAICHKYGWDFHSETFLL